MSDFNQSEELQSLFKGFADRAADIFRTVINMTTEVRFSSSTTATAELLSALSEEELVRVSAPFSKGLPGEMAFLMSKTFTAKIVDFMIMGDGEVEFMPEEHLDGIVEAINQVLGNENVYLSDRLGVAIRNEVKAADTVQAAALAESYAGWFLCAFDVKIEGQEQEHFWALLQADSAEELAKMLASLTDPAMATPKEIAAEAESAENAAKAAAAPSAQDVPPTTASEAQAAASAPAAEPINARKAAFTQFASSSPTASGSLHGKSGSELGRVMDLDLPIVIELGRTRMLIKDILELGPGSIVELNKLVGEPIDLYVNEKKFAQGEVVVIDENFGVRITDLVPEDTRVLPTGS
jgi:flagellar motor switch protein FliN